MSFVVTNILDELQDGERFLQEDLSSFECPVNSEIEDFIRTKAIDFAKRKLSITYIVSDESDGKVLGYFTLTHKSIIIGDSNLSTTTRKKLARYSRMEKSSGDYMTSAFLLAQFGKNYAIDGGTRINGAELMQLATDVLLHIQRQSGGGQMLICVGGRGFYQEWGKDPIEMLPGTVINIPAGVKHWHGATDDSWFSHLAIEIPCDEVSTEWCDAVE